MHALIIDDVEEVREILGIILKDLGFEVTEATNGREALAMLKTIGKVDLALVDLYLPEMNGIEFVRAVRAQSAYAGMKMMMVTTETNRTHIEAALKSGADEYLMKPYTKDMLKNKLKLLKIF
jgi:two-component system chemotaxis response regulator CheY